MKLRLFTAVTLTLWSAISFGANCVYNCPTGVSGQVVTRSIYTLSNNANTKFADWVAYHVTPSTINGPTRSRNWKADPNIASSNTLEPADYTDANAILKTDRGHQVPLASFSNTADWATLNYLSNITPQASNLNQGPWVDLETAVRDLVATGQDVYVVSGPLYEWNFGTLPQADESHTIPSGYFKVVITDVNGWVEASAFIMEQNAARSDDFCDAEVTINSVESRSGLNIMPSLPSYKESAVEGQLGGLTSALGCN
ncbi:MAG: DNA/RNA non-specific endonuclease [Paraglaciecola sp.]|uniref:DNA/RNA non-specific endonuclease n=1 Tax=Pseudomonadati TaxID=3379134 RepID=UPI00273EA6EC|nr:DNA/RNA non-specific endonuclease [Paraglaciecola sp.]MDP5032230.1 DNA/RNA non-specific endonuclease [Paraglaciecola sp.]MDP5131767.1 DNA/RNA non-specific endonuclease [Paraglaciecola sp.]